MARNKGRSNANDNRTGSKPSNQTTVLNSESDVVITEEKELPAESIVNNSDKTYPAEDEMPQVTPGPPENKASFRDSLTRVSSPLEGVKTKRTIVFFGEWDEHFEFLKTYHIHEVDGIKTYNIEFLRHPGGALVALDVPLKVAKLILTNPRYSDYTNNEDAIPDKPTDIVARRPFSDAHYQNMTKANGQHVEDPELYNQWNTRWSNVPDAPQAPGDLQYKGNMEVSDVVMGAAGVNDGQHDSQHEYFGAAAKDRSIPVMGAQQD